MKDPFLFLSQLPLFEGIRRSEIEPLFSCLNAKRAAYRRQEIILIAGEPAKAVGIVLSGAVQIVREDYLGNRNILSELSRGALFAESYACVQAEKLPVTAVSVTDSEVLWIDYRRIINPCSSACRFHSRLIENMLKIMAAKNILLNQKIEHISQKTLRGKILSYLSGEAAKNGADEFDIAFDRQEMADYLCVDRSALSGELGRLRRAGILDFCRNHFRLDPKAREGMPD